MRFNKELQCSEVLLRRVGGATSVSMKVALPSYMSLFRLFL